jgi:hypothetical protein
MADAARPAWVDDKRYPFGSRFVTLDAHGDVRRETPRGP